MTEQWPEPLLFGVTPEQAQRMWPRDPSFRPDKIRLARQARGLTFKALAERSGVSARRISRLERNLTTPTDDDKEYLSGALGFPPRFFAMDDLVIRPRWCGGMP